MDIGKKQEERVAEPIFNPVPQKVPDVMPEPEPVPVREAPVPEREKVEALAWLEEVQALGDE